MTAAAAWLLGPAADGASAAELAKVTRRTSRRSILRFCGHGSSTAQVSPSTPPQRLPRRTSSTWWAGRRAAVPTPRFVVRRVKDRTSRSWDAQLSGGNRDVLINGEVELQDGSAFLVEIQLHLQVRAAC